MHVFIPKPEFYTFSSLIHLGLSEYDDGLLIFWVGSEPWSWWK